VEAIDMFTIRNLGGVSLLVFGSTFLWLTPAFASKGIPTDGLMWGVTRILALVTIAGFGVATYGLFAREGWWEAVALGSAALGLASLLPYWLAAHTDPGAPMNLAVHVLGIGGVFVLLLVPQLENWVDGHVMGA